MRNSSILLWCAATATAAAAVASAEETADKKKECSKTPDGTCIDKSTYDPIHYCGTFMAPSTLGENVNMGIYAGRDLKATEDVPFPDIAIPLRFREWGEHTPDHEDGTLWERYIWVGSVADIETYDDTDREDSRAVFVPGVGCTINGVMDMHNIESTHGSTYDVADLHRSKDPGAGAFTPYINSKSTAVIDIAAGQEIFADYGEDWVPEIPGAQITFNPVMDEAEDFLRDDLLPFMKEYDDKLTPEVKQGLWKFTEEFPLNSKTYSVLPRNREWHQVQRELETTKEKAEAADKEDRKGGSVVRKVIRENASRDLSWLQKNGYCQDHIKPGKSTIDQAGHGAFATRFLPEGSIVGYAPLVHVGVHGRQVYNITVPTEDGGERYQQDIVLNYSFGHKNSTVLLTPYGAMVNYINHQPAGKANVKVRWPDKELIAHKPEWLNESALFLRDTLRKIGLSFEYIALRDIEEGEEIFMDYGPEWEAAWEKHVANWKPVEGAELYAHSTTVEDDELLTLEEQETTPYPDNLVTMCIASYQVNEENNYVWMEPFKQTSKRVYCDVIDRYDGGEDEDGDEQTLYTVRYETKDGPIDVEDVPQDEGLFIYDKAYSADWHLPNAFRHEIMIPDDVMPKTWENGAPFRDY